ncbi:unnamed protein product [Protopolystoma xenopodis]|uniref:Uncharacterized protein n=1 Tax=Protopolystoma xenopodis TaxID=117903 RepID=A0A448XB34_9PLAT|nr:unnamed protein product [Protopolystoma xenopodis]
MLFHIAQVSGRQDKPKLRRYTTMTNTSYHTKHGRSDLPRASVTELGSRQQCRRLTDGGGLENHRTSQMVESISGLSGKPHSWCQVPDWTVGRMGPNISQVAIVDSIFSDHRIPTSGKSHIFCTYP